MDFFVIVVFCFFGFFLSGLKFSCALLTVAAHACLSLRRAGRLRSCLANWEILQHKISIFTQI